VRDSIGISPNKIF